MASEIITHFDPDPERLAVISECMQNYDVGEPNAEWPNNLLSRSTVVYGSGLNARGDSPVRHAVEVEELALCRRLAAEAAEVMAGAYVGMGSESSDPFRGFFIAGTAGETTLRRIDENLIRSRFGGTIFPPAPISVEPLTEAGVWWGEVEADGSESGEDYFAPWRAMVRWFRENPAFVDAAFARIGDREALWNLPREGWPTGTEITGSYSLDSRLA